MKKENYIKEDQLMYNQVTLAHWHMALTNWALHSCNTAWFLMDRYTEMVTTDAGGPQVSGKFYNMLCLCCDRFVVSTDFQLIWAWQVLAYSSHLFSVQ